MWSINLLSACFTVVVGIILLFATRFFFLCHPFKCFGRMCNLLSVRSRRRSLLLALAGTLGVGNIYGVALGIMLGGEGSVFWLFVSSFFAMAVKYSESVVATATGSSGRGMMIPIEKSFGTAGKPIAVGYCKIMLLLSLFMGAFIQSDSLISSAAQLFYIGEILAAIIFLVFVIIVISGGGEKIKNATEAIIPLATIFYVALSFVAIIKDASNLPGVISRIVGSAFSSTSMLFGVLPVISSTAFSQGFARGMLSNEAGAGSSAMAHSEGDVSASDAGLFGIVEIIFDTNILCLLTAFVVLLEVSEPTSYTSPMALVFSAFGSGVGEWSRIPLFLCIVLFAYSTVICWYYYGLRCIAYLGYEKSHVMYSVAFCIFILLPLFLDSIGAVYISDLLLFLMSLPTLICLLFNIKMIEKTTLDSGLCDRKNKVV